MHGVEHHFPVHIMVAILLIGTAVGIAVKWQKLPYPIALVIVGLLVGCFQLLPGLQMDPELVMFVFLPPLLFAAAYQLKFSHLKSIWIPAVAMATVGVIISAVVTGGFLHYYGHVIPLISLLIGSMLAATDPVSVVALFRELSVDKRIALLLEGESLLNDGTSVALFGVLQACVITASSLHSSLGQLTLSFTVLLVGGVVIGLAAGYVAARASPLCDDHLLQCLLTTCVAYGTFLMAEAAGASPIIAVVVASAVFGNLSRTSPTTEYATGAFWEYMVFLVNSFVFVLIGTQINIRELHDYGWLIGMALAGLFVGRALVSYILAPITSGKDFEIGWPVRHILFWGSLRGALSMALALSLPISFPGREIIIVVIFGVVLSSLVMQGLTIEPLINHIMPGAEQEPSERYSQIFTKLQLEEQASERLKALRNQDRISEFQYNQLDAEIKAKQLKLYESLHEMPNISQAMSATDLTNFRKELTRQRVQSLYKLVRQGKLSAKDMARELNDRHLEE